MDPGTYRFYVHDFTSRNAPNSSALAASEATVTVYSGSGDAPRVFTVPAGTGNVWHVFNLDGDSGLITPVHNLTYQSQPGKIDFPRITSFPLTHAIYGEPYAYQVEAEDPDEDTLTYTLVDGPDGMVIDPFSGLIQWTPVAGQGSWFDAEVRVSDGRCGSDTQKYTGFLTYLPVVRFEVDPCSGFNPGGEITLTWQTERADTVVIDQGIGEVPASGSLTIPSPEQPIAYTLTAVNGAGQDQEAVPVRLDRVYNDFWVGCANSPGETVSIAWDIPCANSCVIDQGIGEVPTSGSLTVAPEELPTVYTLTCSNGAGSRAYGLNVAQCRPEATITADVDCDWFPGEPLILEWETSRTNNCSIVPDIGSVPANGTMEVFPGTEEATYAIVCNGGLVNSQVRIDPRKIKFWADRTTIHPGQSTTLLWESTCFDTLSIDQGIGSVTPAAGSIEVTPDQLPITYTLTATSGQVSESVSLTINNPLPLVTFSSSPAFIKPGESATLTWTTELATSCTIEPDLDTLPPIGAVALNGSIAVSPGRTTTYTLTATGPGGETRRTIPVTYIRPTATIYANPEHLDTSGQSTTLTWVFANADTCMIEPGIGEVQPGESLVVTPQATTTYTITATGPGGTATDSVTVSFPTPTAEISADPEHLDTVGQSATLSWVFANADTCVIEPGIGEVQSGRKPGGHPPERPPPIPSRPRVPAARPRTASPYPFRRPRRRSSADPEHLDTVGQSATLSWVFANADTCVIEPGVGEVQSGESLVVTPQATTTYTITAAGPGGTATDSITVSFPKPATEIHADPEHLDTVGQSATLSWVFANAETCVIEPGIGEVQSGESLVVTPQSDHHLYDYRHWSRWHGARTSSPWPLRPPAVDIHADKETLDEGETATLTWTFDHADTCTIDHGIGEVQSGGSRVVDPAGTTTYWITASGPGGIARDWVTLTCLAPAADIQANPATVTEGQAATLSWQVDHAATVVIEPDIGSVDANGSFTVAPVVTTTYTLTASGRGGTTSDQATLTVVNPPSISLIDPDGDADQADTSYTVRWTDRDPDSNAAIALYYDINNSGADGTLIVSGIEEDPDGLHDAYTWDTSDIPAGSYYVYARIEDGTNDPAIAYSPGTVTVDHSVSSETKLTAGNGEAYDYFGAAVAIDGDFAVVGSAYHGDAGAAYIFQKEGAAWVEKAMLTSGDGASGEHFGESVSISGNTVVIGASNGNGNAGAAYVFVHDGTTWTQQAILTASDAEAGSNFGGCVSVSGDTLVVGAPQQGGPGAAYVFTRQDNVWAQTQKMVLAGETEDVQFGAGVAIHGEALIVGAPYFDNYTGAAFVYRRNGSEWIQESQLAPGDAVVWGKFGNAVAISQTYAIVGNVGMSEMMIDGAAYIFAYDGTSWSEQAKISASDVDAGEKFADSVAINDAVAAVGEPKSWETGAVYLFTRTGDEWIVRDSGGSGEGEGEGGLSTPANMQKLMASDGASEDNFGGCVALDGDHLIVGAQLDDDKGNYSGSAYIYPLVSVDISADPTTVWLGGEGWPTTTLSWTSRGVDSVTINPEIGSVDANGSQTVSPQQTTTYTITGTKNGGATVTAGVTVTVIDPSVTPTVTISAAPETIVYGESSTLNWSATNAVSVALDNEIGTAPIHGSLVVSPEMTTTYTVMAVSDAGTATASVTVTVDNAPLTLAIVSPVNGAVVGNATVQVTGRVTPGATVTVNGVSAMVSENTFHAEIYLDSEGQHSITAVAVDSYGEQATAQVYVYYRYLPTVSLTTSEHLIQSGETVTLAWSGKNSDQCVLEPLMIEVPCEGTLEVSPEADTVYTINATGLGKTARDSLLVIVGNAYGNPSVEEQVHLEAINRARANPLAEAERLEIDLNEGPPREIISENPVPPLTFNRFLSLAAALHTEDMVVNKYQAHEGVDGRQPWDRMIDAGYLGNAGGENLASNAQWVPIEDSNELSSVLHDNLFIDAGVDSRGHRINILTGLWKEAGIGFQLEPNKADFPYGGVVTCDFGAFTDGPNFLLGVVYDDVDNSGDYTGGEGLDGVKISVDSQTTFTADAGGYGLPIGPGVYTVAATLSDGRVATKPVTMEDQNIKIDFTLADFETDPAPKLSVSMESGMIYRGQTIQFSWASEHAQGVSIDQDIGAVPTSGAIEVAPVEDTVYTITAVNEHGSTSRTISITFTDADPPPIVQLTVNPGEIPAGDNATLSWTSTYADTLSIDQDIGVIEPSGTMTVYPLQTTMYTITATGSGGTTTASAVVTVNHPITLQITEPLDGAVISDTAVTVRGTIAHANGLETGLMVNGVATIIVGGQFTANHVPLVQGDNTITATATDTSGLTLSDSITVDAEMPENYIRLTATPVSGTSPFETTLRIDSSFAIASCQLTNFGPDDPTYSDVSLDERKAQVTTEGVHDFSVEVTDSEGNIYTDEVSVEVVDEEALDALLQDKWTKMKTALMAGDIGGALEFHHEHQREKYEGIYNALGSDLITLAGQMQDISWISYVNGLAKYKIQQDHEIDNQVVTITYYIYFSRDANGLWLIESY